MHIINLAIKCKTATGDNTKIVCMNSDYRVIISTEDCGTFTEAPVKKLILRYGKEYQEVDIEEGEHNGQTVLQSYLPIIEHWDYVDMGVCGKNEDDPKARPIYTSTAARFTCDSSALCGVAILKADPVLAELDIRENGAYIAEELGADGFYRVDVNVPPTPTEARVVELDMSVGNQIIQPTDSSRTMRQVTVMKPVNLIPANVRGGVNIGGVTGAYSPITEEITIKEAGEYTPSSGVDGFSKVIADVPATHIPIEIATASEMNAALKTADVGSVFKYIGTTTDAYESGALYVVEEIVE